MKIDKHRLTDDDGSPVKFRQTPNISSNRTIDPQFLVIHYTAGSSFESSVDWLTDKAAKASAHLVIGRGGEIAQLADFNARTWHAGVSTWLGLSGLNSHSIGIELDNVGHLERVSDGWLSSFQGVYPDSDVIEAIHKNGHEPKGWQRYTQIQISTLIAVAGALVDAYGLKDVIGHDDIAPSRKSDPGPAFPMDMVRARVLGRESDEPEHVVTKTRLNIRTGPATDYETLEESPLDEGTELNVLGSNGLWLEVEVLDDGKPYATGWVHGHYVKTI
jgi:N-acetylmuramoyl-L-alanine amidase